MTKTPSKTKPTNANGTDVKNGSNKLANVLSLAVDVILFIYTVGFACFRSCELLSAHYPRHCASLFIGACVLHCFPLIGRGSKRVIHIASIVAIIYCMDFYATKPLPSAAEIRNQNDGIAKTIVITGANSGVGFETARQLAVTYGMNVIMGCRSKARCDAAADIINAEIASSKLPSSGSATPRIIDLSNFDSVKSFASQLKEKNLHVDVLCNNAGYNPPPNLPVNEYGLNPAFTSMHLSHFLLTELLLVENPSLRVVNTASGASDSCIVPFAVLPKSVVEWLSLPQNPGCVDEDFLSNGIRSKTSRASYFEAKAANIMHVVELTRHHDRSTAIAINLSFVRTSILWIMSSIPAGWMKSAKIGVLPILQAILSSDEDLMNGMPKGREWSDGGIVMNGFGWPEEAFSGPLWTSKRASEYGIGKERMKELGEKLWEASVNILKANDYLE